MNDAVAGNLCVLFVVGFLVVAWFRRKFWNPSWWKWGTARWCTRLDLHRAGMLKKGGLPIGRTRRGDVIYLRKFTHIAIFAPSGAGKGVSYLIPFLLSYRNGSCIVNDPKGELYKLTAAARRAMGQKVYVLDPFLVTGKTDSWNILDFIPQGPECVDHLRPLGEAMVIRPPEGDRDPHWNDRAANVLTAMLVLIMQLPEGRDLQSLRSLVSNPKGPLVAPLELRARGFESLAGSLEQLEDKERAGVYSTVHRHTTFLDSPAITRVIEQSTFDMRELLNGNITVYLVLPPSQLEAQSRWLRLVIASLIRMIADSGGMKRECLFLLDEAGQLGHMPPLEQGLTLMRGYGLKMCFVWQSMGQLKSVFKDREGLLLDNTDVQIYFGTQSYSTAEYVSKMLGNETITVESANAGDSTNWGGHHNESQQSRNWSRSWSEKERALLTPDEVMQTEKAVIFVKGIPPLQATRILYYSDKLFRRRKWLPILCLLFVAGLMLVWWCDLWANLKAWLNP